MFEFEFRYLPDQNPDALLAELQNYAEQELLPEMQSVSSDAGFTWEFVSDLPPLSTEDDAHVTQLANSISGGNSTTKVSFGTEGGLYSRAGIPTIVCGPGSIDQAHKLNEFVSLEQMILFEDFLRGLMTRVCID